MIFRKEFKFTVERINSEIDRMQLTIDDLKSQIDDLKSQIKRLQQYDLNHIDDQRSDLRDLARQIQSIADALRSQRHRAIPKLFEELRNILDADDFENAPALGGVLPLEVRKRLEEEEGPHWDHMVNPIFHEAYELVLLQG
jgi:predicted RNase H-like nuclease (RuvC/YqgF family)